MPLLPLSVPALWKADSLIVVNAVNLAKLKDDKLEQLEKADAISLEEYKKLAAEATSLLHQCSAEIQTLAEELKR